MNKEVYTKPRLKKHETLRQITFSDDGRDSSPPPPPFRITWRAAWGLRITDGQGKVTEAKGVLIPPEELAHLLTEAQTGHPQG